uniref:Transmembrane protein n=1 Tax=Spironucleus salmonicida TaxID=348837 RepID=V6LLI1_9EUKA|eukprot:EST45407.1 Hypothetical protein SS50377_14683 [Spironucleus salmonicida]
MGMHGTMMNKISNKTKKGQVESNNVHIYHSHNLAIKITPQVAICSRQTYLTNFKSMVLQMLFLVWYLIFNIVVELFP